MSNQISINSETDSTHQETKSNSDKEIVYYAGITDIPIEKWIAKIKPSKISNTDYGWISAIRFEREKRKEKIEEEDLAGLQKAWEILKTSVKNPHDISKKQIFELAEKYNVTAGKWMFWADTGPRIDYLWAIVAKGIVDKKTLSTCAKTSTCNLNGSSTPLYDVSWHAKNRYTFSHVVCIYTENFLDFNEVCESEKSIRNLGLKLSLHYKPDVFTYLGIYSKNPWKINPIIYRSTYSIIDKNGIIEST